MKKIVKIVLTGGPCAGKTTVLSLLEKEISEKFPNWYLLIVPETATELIANGIRPFGGCLSLLRFQKYVLMKQLDKEKLYMEVAKELPYDNILIVCDRGLCDNIAYCENEECSAEDMFKRLLKETPISITEARDSYDGVIHLVTAAKGTNAYTTANNSSRIETPEEAIDLDTRTLNAWIGHPNLKIIDNSTNFEDKVNKALSEIYYLMGLKDTIEYNRKILVKMPDLKKLSYNRKITIIQNYLYTDDENVEKRIRQRKYGDNCSYYYTEKYRVDIKNNGRLKADRRISEREYLSLLAQINPKYRQIVKDRYCFVYENQYFNLDVFPFDKEKALLEISLEENDKVLDIPDFIEIIKDVTDDESFKNISLSEKMNLD